MSVAVAAERPNMLLAARWWAEQGAPVFPVWWPDGEHCGCGENDCGSPAKHPITAHGLTDATTDMAQIDTWWGRHPKANIAVATGVIFDVIDVDGAVGVTSYTTHVELHGVPRHTAVAHTGRGDGGLHFYTAGAGMGCRNAILPGVDIKGRGGYVVVPPSAHISGRTYTWLNAYGTGVLLGDVDWPTWHTTLAPPRLSQPAPLATHQLPTGGNTAYGLAVLRNVCDRVGAAVEGTRWETAALDGIPTVARAIAGGQLEYGTAVAELQAAAARSGLTGKEVRRVGELVAKMLREGIRSPIAPADVTFTPAVRPAPEAEPAAEPSEVERTSWWPRNIQNLISGEDPDPETPPAFLARDDGHRLLYAGKVNALIGESESGKTWVALFAVAQALAVAEPVLYLDFEDSAAGIIGRLRALGATENHLQHLTYVSPDEPLHPQAAADHAENVNAARPRLIVLDGVNAAMTLLGLDLEKNKDATSFSLTVLKPLKRTGAAVVTIDHVPKSKDNRGNYAIGAQAKRADVDGAAYVVEVAQPFGKGMSGRLRLTVAKDRAGLVRAVSAFARQAGTVTLDSTSSGTVSMRIEAPDLRPEGERPPFRPTRLMERVSRFLEQFGEPASTTQIEQGTKGKTQHVRTALDVLVTEGYVGQEPGPRKTLVHRLVRPYHEADDVDFDVDIWAAKTDPVPEKDGLRPGVGETPVSRPRPDLLPPTGRDGVAGRGRGDLETTLSKITGDGVRPTNEDDEPDPWWQR